MNVTNRKKCCVCNKYLTEENQYANSKKWYICRKCANDYFKRREARKREVWKNILKNLKINGCAICGYNECTEALDFHHINPWEKKFQISMCCIWRKNEVIAKELEKCVLLCKNCHAKLHATTRKNPLERQGYIKELNSLEVFMADREECSKKQARRH